MDITNLKNNHQLLVDYLCTNNYCKDIRWIIRRCIKTALKNGSLPQVISYEDLFLFESEQLGYKPKEGRYKKMKYAMGVLEAFDLEGKYLNGTCTGFMEQPKLIDSLNPYFLNLANRHLKNGQTNGKRSKTVWTEYRAIINFFSHLMSQKANTLAEVNPMMIYSFFFDGTKRVRGRDYCNLVRAVLKKVDGEVSSAATITLSFLPSIKNGRNAEVRGLYNYYAIANNSSSFNTFSSIMEYSMYKTYAGKLQSSVGKVINKFYKNKEFAIPYTTSKGESKLQIFYNGGFKRQEKADVLYHDNLPQIYTRTEPTLIQRLKACKCELCGATTNETVMFQVRTLKELKGTSDWENKMLKKHRKTLILCKDCNDKVHQN
jgi:hypothetical protein